MYNDLQGENNTEHRKHNNVHWENIALKLMLKQVLKLRQIYFYKI